MSGTQSPCALRPRPKRVDGVDVHLQVLRIVIGVHPMACAKVDTSEMALPSTKTGAASQPVHSCRVTRLAGQGGGMGVPQTSPLTRPTE